MKKPVLALLLSLALVSLLLRTVHAAPAETGKDATSPEEAAPLQVPASMERLTRMGTFVIDPGHGGFDAGLPGEKDLMLDLAERLAAHVKKGGGRAVLTRSSNLYVSLDDRARRVWKERGSLFLSLHQSEKTFFIHAVSRPGVSEESRRIRTRLVDRLSQIFGGERVSDRLLPLQLTEQVVVPGVVLEIPSDINFRDEKNRKSLFDALVTAFSGDEPSAQAVKTDEPKP